MTMETFNFPYHTPTHRYPQGDAMKLGRGYQFAQDPVLPLQRSFRLKFEAMKWFLNIDGSVDTTTEPLINMQLLVAFYERVYTSRRFYYPHPIYGTLIVRFEQPLEVPQSLKNGNGTTDSFEIQFIEQPL